jgi:phenylacetate-coenzyme A ligase PaaK-like adenylate-forming protein
MFESLKDSIFKTTSDREFNSLALDIFRYQAASNKTYHEYLGQLGVNPYIIGHIKEIPFLPIDFFKYHKIISGEENDGIIFESSGTTSENRSRHYVNDPQLYINSLTKCFRMFYGDPADYCILALLPSYPERSGSSLVFMAEHLIKLTSHSDSEFYLHNTEELAEKLVQLERKNQKTILLGVSFALLDLAERYPIPLKKTIIIETGGMKGRREEITREELHQILKKAFRVKEIHSEYGMTELLSQAWSKKDGIFQTPPWMKIMIRDAYDPFSYVSEGRSGGVNVIDLANIHSCSFISTQDIGKLHSDGSFEVLGRFDISDIRGCNLMVG